MLDPCRTTADARAAFQSCKTSDPTQRVQFYDKWADNYEKDHDLMNYRAPHLAVNFLSENFSGTPEDAVVLDVACGSGWVAKLMFDLGFRHFVGVDGSECMLEKAAQTDLYQDLKLAILGPQLLPTQAGVFDVVIIVGALDAGFVPVAAVRELCRAAKPGNELAAVSMGPNRKQNGGGLVCMCRGDHRNAAASNYKKELEKELQLMEEEGLWSLLGIHQSDKYMEDPHCTPETEDELQEDCHLTGTVYLYQKCTK